MIRRPGAYYLREIRGSLRYQGMPVFLWRAMTKLLSPVVSIDQHTLCELELTQPIEQLAARVDCSIGPASEADVDAIVEMEMGVPGLDETQPLDDEQDYLRARYEQAFARVRERYLETMRAGEVCFVARIGDQIVHSNWISFHGCAPVPHRPIKLGPGECYTTDAWTRESWRGQAIHQAVLSHMLRYAKARGYRRAYTIPVIAKPASGPGVRRIGWKLRGRVLYITPRGLNRTWMVCLSGDVEPMTRYSEPRPARG